MSNIFQFTPVTYFQVPETVIESGKWAKLKPSARDLYTLLLYLAQKTSRATIALTAGDALRDGISLRAMTDARECLESAKLIRAERGSHGHTYELLDPVTGEPLEKIEDLAAVKPEIVEEYFRERLASRNHTETANGMQVSCPFHVEKKDRDKSLHVSFTGGGVFKCHGQAHGHACEASDGGGILEFEMLMAAKDGDKITKDRAYSRVRAAHLTNMRTLAKRKAKELAEARAIL